MVTAHDFLVNLAMVLCVAAIATVLFQRIRQPVVLGYLLAGLIVGPNVPIPLVADPAIIAALAELGVILLMFSIGLEFRLKRLAEIAPTGGVIALIEVSVMVSLGFLAGRLFGWGLVPCLFTGAIVAISSTSIVAKAFEEQRVSARRKDVVFGVLIAEDLIAILLMVALAVFSTGRDPSAAELGTAALRLGASLLGILVVGLLIVPRLFRSIQALHRPETTTVAAVGVCFAVALFVQALGYSVALGAFLAGMLIAESRHGHEVEQQVRPVRDVLGAVFFVAVGMLIDPAVIVQQWAPVLVLTLVVLGGKVFAVSLGAFLVGNLLRTSVTAGMSLAQIGEFSFILAGLGVSTGAVDPSLYPIAVTVSALTTFTTPAFIRAADRLADRVDRGLPGPLQRLTALYTSWLEALRTAPAPAGRAARVRAVLRVGALDALALVGLVVSHALFGASAADWLVAHVGLEDTVAGVLVAVVALLVAAPLGVSLLRAGGRLGDILAEPLARSGVWASTPALRRALVAVVRLAVVLAAGLPVLVATLPFLPPFQGVVVLVLAQGALALLVWRRASDLDGELRSGAERLFASLRLQSMEELSLAPPVPEPDTVVLVRGDAAIGRTLIELNLRARTGATVLGIGGPRGGKVPTGREPLAAGDVLMLAGTSEAVAAATAVLRGGEANTGTFPVIR